MELQERLQPIKKRKYFSNISQKNISAQLCYAQCAWVQWMLKYVPMSTRKTLLDFKYNEEYFLTISQTISNMQKTQCSMSIDHSSACLYKNMIKGKYSSAICRIFCQVALATCDRSLASYGSVSAERGKFNNGTIKSTLSSFVTWRLYMKTQNRNFPSPAETDPCRPAAI